MKELNTIENKQRFFAQYWGQMVGFFEGFVNQEIDSDFLHMMDARDLLELTPLSSISDEHFNIIVKKEDTLFKGGESHNEYLFALKRGLKRILDDNKFSLLPVEHTDFLRGNGYALDWTTPEGDIITVEMQLEFGWVKLKHND